MVRRNLSGGTCAAGMRIAIMSAKMAALTCRPFRAMTGTVSALRQPCQSFIARMCAYTHTHTHTGTHTQHTHAHTRLRLHALAHPASQAAARSLQTAASTADARASRLSAAHRRMVDALLSPHTHMRLDAFLSQMCVCARTEARKFLKSTPVTSVDARGTRVRHWTGGEKVDPRCVEVEGAPLPYAGVPLHLVLHKPPTHVCTHALTEGRTVYELLPGEFQMRKPPLNTVGRLDKETSGLLLFTQSGALLQRLTTPRRVCEKVYVVQLRDRLHADGREAATFASGTLQLVDGTVCRPAKLLRHPTLPNVCRVVLHEGRYHQVRRMFAALGHVVVGLHRAEFAGLSLERMQLAEGQWRFLTADELLTLLEHSAVRQTQPELRGPRVRLLHKRGSDAHADPWGNTPDVTGDGDLEGSEAAMLERLEREAALSGSDGAAGDHE